MISRLMKQNLNLKVTILLFFFALVKTLKKSPEILGKELGEHLVKTYPDFFSGYNVIKGFLNLEINCRLTISYKMSFEDVNFGKKAEL